MTMENMYRSSRSMERMRNNPLSQWLEGFSQWLLDRGFATTTVRHHLARVYLLCLYLVRKGVRAPASLHGKHLHAFLSNYLPHHKCPRAGKGERQKIAFSIHRFLSYLSSEGFLAVACGKQPCYQHLLDDYLTWQRDYHHLAPGTLAYQGHYARQFLAWLGRNGVPARLPSLSAEKIQQFFFEFSRNHGPCANEHMTQTLRGFCRYCTYQDYIDRPLEHAVPVFRHYKLSTIPRGIADEDAQRLLASIDRNIPVGRRDYAMLCMLHEYGVRGGQVRGLRMEDLDWRKDTIRFHALKRGKQVILPLADAVGTSLLDYLKRARPSAAYPQVFLTTRAPFHPLYRSNTLSNMIRYRMRKVGIDMPTQGAHVFRHAFATRMLANGHPLKSIADLLGHRALSSAAIYAKVDFRALNQVALDWPEEVP